jgi:membrane-associated phospholipid phosphatase
MAASSGVELTHRAAPILVVLALSLAGLILGGWAAGSLLVPHIAFDAGATTTVVMTGAAAVNAWMAVSWLGSGTLVIVAGLCICVLLARRGSFDMVAMVVVGVVGAAVLSRSVKLLVNRPRPAVAQVAVSDPSFPSGHATESAAFYGVLIALAVLLPFRNAIRAVAIGACVTLMLAVAYSRLALGVHYPTDVIAGLLLGGAWALVTVVAIRPPGAAPWRRDPAQTAKRGRGRTASSLDRLERGEQT